MEFNWERIQAWLQTAILYLMGLYFVSLARPGGDLGNYINVQNLGWLTWVAAGILMLLAISSTVELMSQSGGLATHNNQRTAGSLGSWMFISMMAVPLILGLGLPSKPLGADAVTGEVSSDVTALGFNNTTSPSADIPPEDRNLLDWLRVFGNSPDLTEFEGQDISVIGFIYRDARFRETDQFMVVRFTLSCCVADARPLGLVVQSSATLTQDTWVKVTGKVSIQTVDGVDTPVIMADSIEVTAEPEQPYLYF